MTCDAPGIKWCPTTDMCGVWATTGSLARTSKNTAPLSRTARITSDKTSTGLLSMLKDEWQSAEDAWSIRQHFRDVLQVSRDGAA
jgi:hypothetical protein